MIIPTLTSMNSLYPLVCPSIYPKISQLCSESSYIQTYCSQMETLSEKPMCRVAQNFGEVKKMQLDVDNQPYLS